LKYDKKIIENTINNISKSMEKIKSELDNMCNLLTDIESNWKGLPSSYLTNNMSDSFKTFSGYIEVLGEYNDYLNGVLEDIKTIDNNNNKIIDSAFGG